MSSVSNKVTWWDATSTAGPAVSELAGNLIVAWRGNQNSRNLTVANVIGSSGGLSGTTLRSTVLADASDHAPSLSRILTVRYTVQLAWAGINGAHSLNAADLGVNTSSWQLTGQIVGRALVAGDSVSATSGPVWTGGGAGDVNRLGVLDQSSRSVLIEETGDLVFGAPSTSDFIVDARGPAQALATDNGETLWAWTASDGALTFALVRPGFPLPTAVVRSAQASGFGPSSIEPAYPGGPLCVAWTGIDGTGALNVAALNVDAIRNGTDPISAVYTLPETSSAAPALLHRPFLRTLAIFWTGTDGAGTLNACDVQL
ncbi:hypothetical protein [Catenulispora acidiphila]|nr:hypothetical protein [Catenulispora acidiphila]